MSRVKYWTADSGHNGAYSYTAGRDSGRMKIEKTAIAAGIISLVAIYALGGIIIIFVLSLLSEVFSSPVLMSALRVGGYLALAFPAYVAARAATHQAMAHAMVMGIIEGLAIVLLMTFTFSFEGTLQQHVLLRMLPVFGGVLVLALVAGALVEWIRNRENKTRLQ